MHKIDYIQIYGERNSGTNFLHKLLEDNLKDKPEIGYKYGWKHGFTNLKLINANPTDQVIFICIFKNPYSWISSMHNKPHHAPQLYFMDFSDFIREEWVCYKGKSYQIRAKNLDKDPLRPEEEMTREWNPHTKKRFESVVHLRNGKNLRFLRLQKHVEHVIYLQYEELITDPHKVLQQKLKPFNLQLKETFKNTSSYHGKDPKLSFDRLDYYKQKKYMEKINPKDLNYINKILDFKLEKQLGYEEIK